MGLTNAEKQRRYRERKKAAAQSKPTREPILYPHPKIPGAFFHLQTGAVWMTAQARRREYKDYYGDQEEGVKRRRRKPPVEIPQMTINTNGTEEIIYETNSASWGYGCELGELRHRAGLDPYPDIPKGCDAGKCYR